MLIILVFKYNFCIFEPIMEANLALFGVSALSGMTGAILAQIVAAVNNYFTDNRKHNFEVNNQFQNRKIEIGENYYYMNGEMMAVIRKNIEFWKNFNTSRGEASLESLKREVKQFTARLDKLNAENWKYDLITLYFNVSFTPDEIQAVNAQSRKLDLAILDLAGRLKSAVPEEKDALLGKYALAVFDMCSHYEAVYAKLEQDKNVIRDELLKDYGVNRKRPAGRVA